MFFTVDGGINIFRFVEQLITDVDMDKYLRNWNRYFERGIHCKIMKNTMISILFFVIVLSTEAQNVPADSNVVRKVRVIKDERLELLAKKQEEFNVLALRSAKGYRLLILSSNDRDKVMGVRAKLLQQFPDQKVYMIFQSPYIKLKFGNFIEKADAEKFRDMITKQGIVSSNVYVIPEMVEVKPEKLKEKEAD